MLESIYTAPEANLAIQLYATFLGAYIVSSLLVYAADMLIPAERITGYKTTTEARIGILNVYRRTLPLTVLNVGVTIPVTVLLLAPFIDAQPVFSWREILKFPVFYLLTDFFFFAAHRLFHVRWLFRRWHEIHHRIKYPVGSSALYAHPLEVAIANVLPVILPPLIVGASLPVYQAWIVIAIFNTVAISHSGFRKISQYHDLHHRQYDVNFGAEIGIMDRIAGTYHRAE